MKVRYSYLPQQFQKCPELSFGFKKICKTGDFTLGKPLKIFEKILLNLLELNMRLVLTPAQMH